MKILLLLCTNINLYYNFMTSLHSILNRNKNEKKKNFNACENSLNCKYSNNFGAIYYFTFIRVRTISHILHQVKTCERY